MNEVRMTKIKWLLLQEFAHHVLDFHVVQNNTKFLQESVFVSRSWIYTQHFPRHDVEFCLKCSFSTSCFLLQVLDMYAFKLCAEHTC